MANRRKNFPYSSWILFNVSEC